MDLNTSVLSQGALEIYIKSGMFKSNKNRLKNIYRERMNTLKEVSNELEIADIKWHIPDTGFYSCIEFLNNIDINWLIKECAKKDIHINTMHDYYLKDYFNNDILKISVGNCEISDIKSGIRDILKLISSFY